MPGVLKRYDAATDSWIPSIGAPTGRTGPLVVKSYNPVSEVAFVSTSATLVDVDAANLTITFTAPPSGQVLVNLEAAGLAMDASTLVWGLRSGGSPVAGTHRRMAYNGGSSEHYRLRTSIHLTALTPGTSYTYTWGAARDFGSATVQTIYGGNTGAAQMEVWDAVGSRSVTAVDVAQLLHVRDEKAAATDGGSSVATTWQTRTLNTVKTNEIAGASLAANIITLPAGTYEVDASAPALLVNRHKIRLYNVTASATLITGTTEFTENTAGMATRSVARGRFTLAVTSDVRLDHYTQLVRASNGLGAANALNDGEVETYADVMIRKVG